jgi:hypothetical protein
MGLGDDGFAVAEHDAQEQAFYDFRDRSSWNRFRLRLRDADEPFERGTERQLLIGAGVIAALIVWRLGARSA